MGITIHYKGRIDEAAEVQDMYDALIDIADVMQWKHLFLRNEPINGLILDLGNKCEPVSFIFDEKGGLCNPLSVAVGTHDSSAGDNWVSVKTQFAPQDIHVSVIKLLQFIKKRYIPDLEVVDEGQFWETGDRALLDENFAKVKAAIGKLAQTLASIEVPTSSVDTAEKLAEFLELKLKDLFRKGGQDSDSE
jgi:hypothetical protein